jgi:hypothetical protein
MCHTAINRLGGSSEAQAFEGGMIPNQNWYAPSLTSNREAGLGEWSLKDIGDLLQVGVSQRATVYGPDGRGRVQQPAIHEPTRTPRRWRCTLKACRSAIRSPRRPAAQRSCSPP